MWLRTLMVVAVTSLGLEAPTGIGLQELARDAQTWCDAQYRRAGGWWEPQTRTGWGISPGTFAQSLSQTPAPGLMPNGSDAFAEEQPLLPAGLLAFASESVPAEAMENPFSSVVDRMVVAFTNEVELEWASTPNPEVLASATNLEALDEEEWIPTFHDSFPARSIEATAPAEPRTGKVATALRLTGQAVQAWLSVLPITTATD